MEILKLNFIADFHIHSHYSIATSKKLIPEYIDFWSRLKGINVVGTGDCIHPGWLSELKDKLEPAGNELYKLKKEFRLENCEQTNFNNNSPVLRNDCFFILTAEISNIYKKNGKVRKIHNLLVFDNFDSAEKVQRRLDKLGNISSDGRPILGMDSKYLLEILLESSDKSYLIPAHIWTPWFSVLGSKSGFDTIEECYEDLTPNIFAVETGLSSDPPMNYSCSFLDSFRLVSNSDAHSPEKLGREANLFDTDLSFDGIYNALKYDKGFNGTIEFFPQEGKYHYDGHRKCAIRLNPVQTLENGGLCPVCKKPVTKGVMYRVAELADRCADDFPQKPFYSITSLPDIIAEILCKKTTAKAVKKEYFNIVNSIGSDFYTLLFADLDNIKKSGNEILAEGINRLRHNNVYIEEGYDGEFGKITVFKPSEIKSLSNKTFSLFDTQTEQTKKTEANTSHNSVKFNIEKFQQLNKKNKDAQDALFSRQLPLLNNLLKSDKPKSAKKISLTPKQSECVEHKDGVCMVIAGPGSGKTKVLTDRIIYLIKKHLVNPQHILAITFSNKAAEEMRIRVDKQMTDNQIFINTFHALGLSILKKHCSHFNRSENFCLIDHDEKSAVCENIFALNKTEIKKFLRDTERFKQGVAESAPPNFDKYETELKKLNAFDLDDLIYLPVILLGENQDICSSYCKQYKYIMVDEYQDINARQYELVKLLAGEDNSNLFVIGDPDQAIYAFRGSDVKFISRIKSDYPDLSIITLDKSYRCPDLILQAAGQILNKKYVLTGNNENIKTQIFECESSKSEADFIASRIEKMIGGVRSFSMDSGISDGEQEHGIESFSDFAVLCRTTAFFDEIITAFNNHGIPYQVIGSNSFYKKEPYNSILKDLKTFYYGYITPDELNNDKNINLNLHDELKDLFVDKKSMESILDFFINQYDIDEEQKKRLFNLAYPFSNNYSSFFNALTTRQGIDDFDKNAETVSLMTIHAAKGLEFKSVFIPACEQGMMPFELFGKKDKDELLEEERLFYVGITRTKKYLYLTHAKKRHFRGRVLTGHRSSLLDRLDKELFHLDKREVKKSASSDQLVLFE
ncbi:UvrD-helicase domain-containing protein [bacterium]|nr:UvrD-helicase domain-containing protein [bacterium]